MILLTPATYLETIYEHLNVAQILVVPIQYSLLLMHPNLQYYEYPCESSMQAFMGRLQCFVFASVRVRFVG